MRCSGTTSPCTERLPPSSGRCFSPPKTVLLAAFAVYGTALIIRPVGAVLFGRMADLRGRRAVFVPIIVLMAGATAAVGFLPGYAVIGVLAPVILLLLRATHGGWR
jgi:MFS family permease